MVQVVRINGKPMPTKWIQMTHQFLFLYLMIYVVSVFLMTCTGLKMCIRDSGFGAEIGISTQKLHARGPMGLQALTSYKYFVFGEGQVRT